MKQLIVNHEHLQTRVALVEDGSIQEYHIERDDSNRIVGSIFKGKIRNLEDSLHAAFVDIGLEKNAFLHYWDMIPPSEEALEDGSYQDAERASRGDRGDPRDDEDDDSGSDDDSGNERSERRERSSRRGGRHRNRSNRGDGNQRDRQDSLGDSSGNADAAEPAIEAQAPSQAAPEPPPPAERAPMVPPPVSEEDRPVRVSGLAAKIRSIFKLDAPPPADEKSKQRETPSKGKDSNKQDGGKESGKQDGGRSRSRSRNRNRNRDRDRDDDNRSSGSGGNQQRGGNRDSNKGGGGGNRGSRRSFRNVNVEEIPKQFKVGSEVIVQVTKGMIGEKGPRVTANLSIPGAFMVLMPNSHHKGVSKRIEDRKERARLKQIINSFDLPEGMGCICRTASIGQDAEFLKMDVEMLLEHWHQAERAIEKRRAPCFVYQEPALVERSIRDLLSFGIDEIICDSDDAFNVATSYARHLSKALRPRIRRYNNPTPIFEHFGLNDQIQKIFRRKIVLPSGSEIAIDETQALVAIDVDTAKSKGKDHPETILRTNLEAAEEIARQLRLRNIGGLIVVDFIDMRTKRDQMKVYNKFRDCLERDRAKTKVLAISRLGLLEMTRQREHESLQDAIFEPCFYCSGKGLVKSSISISVEIQRRLRELLRRGRGDSQLRVTVHPAVLTRLKHEDAKILQAMEQEFGGDLSFRSDAGIHQEEFHLIDVKTGKEIF